MVRLARSQWHPADRAIGDRNAHRDTGGGADKGHQRGCVNLSPMVSRITGNPAPAVIDPRPSSVMRGRETPGLAVHPGPTPRRHVGPAAVAIGNPGGGNGRIPDLAVVRRLRPFTISGQVLGAGHVGQLGRDRARRPCGGRPLSGKAGREERIADNWSDGALERVGSGDRRGLVRRDIQRNARSLNGGRAVKHGDLSGLIRASNEDVVLAGGGEGDRSARGLHCPHLTRRKVAEMKIQFSLRCDRLQTAVVQRGQIEFGLAGQVDAAGGNLQFGTRVGLGPERVAGAYRIIRGSGAPLRVVAGAKGYGT